MNRLLWLACWGLTAVSPVLAQEAKLRSTLAGHSGGVSSVAWSPDGKTLASGSDDDTVRLWNVASGKTIAVLQAKPIDYELWGITSTAWSPDGKTLASGSYDKTVRLWNVVSRQNIATLGGHSDGVDHVAWSPNGKTLVSADPDEIKVWDVAARKNTATIVADPKWINSVAYSPDGKVLACGDCVGVVKLRDTTNGKVVAVIEAESGSNVLALAYSPDGKVLALSNDYTVELWSATSYKRVAVLRGHSCELVTYAHGHFGGQYTPAVTSVAFRADGRMLASGSQDETIILWNVASGKKITTLKGHSDSIQSVGFSPDGRLLASGSSDKTIRLWDVVEKSVR